MRNNASPVALVVVFIPTRLSHAVEGLLQEVLPERLSHLGQRIHCNRSRGINPPQPRFKAVGSLGALPPH